VAFATFLSQNRSRGERRPGPEYATCLDVPILTRPAAAAYPPLARCAWRFRRRRSEGPLNHRRRRGARHFRRGVSNAKMRPLKNLWHGRLARVLVSKSHGRGAHATFFKALKSEIRSAKSETTTNNPRGNAPNGRVFSPVSSSCLPFVSDFVLRNSCLGSGNLPAESVTHP
jgi:hypothetical protein